MRDLALKFDEQIVYKDKHGDPIAAMHYQVANKVNAGQERSTTAR